VSVLSHPHSKEKEKKKKVFSDIHMEPPVFQYPLPLVLLLRTAEESGFIFFAPSLQLFIYVDKIPLEPFVLQALSLSS